MQRPDDKNKSAYFVLRPACITFVIKFDEWILNWNTKIKDQMRVQD